MLNIDPWSIFWTVVNLLVLYVVFKKFLYQKVMDVIHAREQMVEEQFAAADKSQKDAEALKESYEKQLSEAKKSANQILEEARERAEEERARQLEETRAKTGEMLEKAKEVIAQEREKAMRDAQGEIAGLAMMAAKKIIETGDVHDTGSGK